MIRRSDEGAYLPAKFRRLAILTGAALLLLEAVYLIVGNLCIRNGVMENFVNSRPEEQFVSWESGLTVLPGSATFKDFTYRSQSMVGQTYVRLAEVSGRVSLIKLLVKTIDIRGVRAKNMDYRYRERIDDPCSIEAGEVVAPDTPTNFEYYPEIPGFDNPPDPKPEDIYSQETESDPWTVKFSGARISGSVSFAYKEIRINGSGSVRGGMTNVLGKSNAIDRGEIRVVPAAVTVGPKLLTEDLDLTVDARVNPFPAVCPDMSEIIAGTSGTLTIAGHTSSGFAMNVDAITPLLPAQGMFSIESGTGELGGRFEMSEGSDASGQLDLLANDVVLKLQEVPLQGDLKVHASLSEGNFATGGFNVSGTTFRLDNMTKTESSAKKQEKLEPWFCNLEFEDGTITYGRPITLESRVRLTMHDTRPVLILLKRFTNQLRWFSLTRNAKEIDGTMDLGFGQGYVTVDNLSLVGEDVEILGWVHVRNLLRNGEIFARHGARAAGVEFNEDGKAGVTVRGRSWFEQKKIESLNGVRNDEPEDK